MSGRAILFGGAVLLLISWLLYTLIYNLVVSPLSSFPGPKLWAISRIPSQLSVLRGHTHLDILGLQERYGPVVRIGPNELAFFTAGAFQDIYGNRAGHKPFAKDRTHYVPPPNGVDHLLSAVDDDVHARHRKLLAPAFSERSLKEQEGIIHGYVDALIVRLRSYFPLSAGNYTTRRSSVWSVPIDIKSWLNYTTFDITGDLMFGESFDCLRASRLHPWIELIFDSIKALAFMGIVNQFPWANTILQSMLPRSVIQKGLDHFNMAAEKVDRRLATETERSDFLSAILKHGLGGTAEKEKAMENEEFSQNRYENKKLTREEIHSDAFIVIIAGSETSATLLSGALFLLCSSRHHLSHLTSTIRSTFPTSSSMTFAATAQVPFLNAVIEESLRLYPPFVTSLSRVAPKGGGMVDGWHVPEGTSVACHHYAAYRSSRNFVKAEEFCPERWLDEADNGEFRDDRKDVLQPFSLGPRGCLGKPLAYAEMRLLLSKLVWHFDIELCDSDGDGAAREAEGAGAGQTQKQKQEDSNWIRAQQVFFLWDKPPLWVRLREREREREGEVEVEVEGEKGEAK